MSLWRCMTDGEHGEAHLLVLIRPWVPEGGLYEVLAYLQSHAEGSFPANCIIQGHPHGLPDSNLVCTQRQLA